MKRPQIIKPLAFAALTAMCAAAAVLTLRAREASRNASQPVTAHFLAMGTMATVTFVGGDAAEGMQIVRDAFEEVEAAASVFREDSPIARLNATGSVRLSPIMPGNFDLAALLRRALDMARATDGAFDPTVNPLMRLWGFRKDGIPVKQPSDDAIAAALEKVGWGNVILSTAPDGATDVSFKRQGMQLDLGGIAKGAAVDYAFDKLRLANFTDFLINLGGNIRVSGRPERSRDEWRVAIRDPANPSRTTGQIAILHSGEAVATSGSYERYVEIDGRRFSHIVDPRTGHPVARQGSVSVVADTAERADACSTAFFVMGLGSEDGGAVLLRAQDVIQASDEVSMPNP